MATYGRFREIIRSMARTAPRTAAVIGYVRVSTDEQSLGPEAQRAAIERWAAARGLAVLAVHEDRGVSGAAALDARPGLLAALDDLARSRAAFLVAAKRDRLARDVIIAAQLERLAARSGAQVATADGAGEGNSPEAALMRRMVDAFAEYERALIRGRTRAALAAKQARGERVSRFAPYGAGLDRRGELTPAPAELAAIKLAIELAARGVPLRNIGAELEAAGHRPRGARWHLTTIARMVRRARGGADVHDPSPSCTPARLVPRGLPRVRSAAVAGREPKPPIHGRTTT